VGPPGQGSFYAAVSCKGAQWLLLAVIVISTFLLAVRLNVTTNVADDPAQARVAKLVLNGERPHVDFPYAYTGGQAYLDALALRIFGDRVSSLRLMLLMFFVAWLPSFWYIARKISSPLAAALLTLLAAVWSVPVFPSPMGSWYGLYFATFGTAALFRYIETRRSRWVFLAGVLAGLSFLAKVSGLYFLLAAVLFLLYDEQNVQDEVQFTDITIPDAAYSVALTIVLIALDVVLLQLLHSKASATEVYHFAVPGIALSFLLIAREWCVPRFPVPVRLWQIAGRLLPLLLGTLLPVLIFLAPYISSGTVKTWFRSSLVWPAVNWQAAFHAAIHPVGAMCAIPLIVMLGFQSMLRSQGARRVAFLATCLMAALLLDKALTHPAFARWIWVSAATAIPLTTMIGVLLLLGRRGSGHAKERSQLMLLIAVAGLCSVVQFPFSVPVYFCCVAPLGILAYIGLAAMVSQEHRVVLLLPVAGFYLAFLVLLILPNHIDRDGLSFNPVQTSVNAPQSAVTRQTGEGKP